MIGGCTVQKIAGGGQYALAEADFGGCKQAKKA
jgi:hypothetical protein